MTTERFRVSTTATGTRRVVKVIIFDEQPQLAAYGRRWETQHQQTGHNPSVWDGTEAAVLYPTEWASQDPRQLLATAIFYRAGLTQSLLAHELVHVAALLYAVDRVRDQSRALTHFNGNHEPLAYAVQSLYSRIAHRLGTLPIGIQRHPYF